MRALGVLVLSALALVSPDLAAQDSPVIQVPAGKRLRIDWSKGRGEALVLRFYIRDPGSEEWRFIEPEVATETKQGAFTPRDPQALAARNTEWEIWCDARVRVRDKLRPARLAKTDEGSRILFRYRESPPQPDLGVTVRFEFE